MTYELRPYQKEAIAAVNSSLNEPGVHPVISLPTGSGKTVVIAELATMAARFGLRVLIMSHVKELLEQTYNHIQNMKKSVTIGLYSAGLDRRETKEQIIVAGIQSLYKNVGKIGRRDIVFIDEAHLVSEDDKSRYRKVATALTETNPNVRFIGLTATPFRMRTGLITTGEKSLFNKIVYEKSVTSLIDEGYLSPIMCRVVKKEVETQGLHIKKGEYVESEIEDYIDKESIIESACNEIVERANEFERKKILIFAPNKKHAMLIQETIKEIADEECELVLGDTKSEDRDSILRRFRCGSLRYLVNLNVLTTGFDNPKIDLVALIRPTASPGLYYQMAGRGLRKAEGKDYCLLLDFGQNIKRHGPIDDLEVKESTKREARYKVCPKCGLIVKATTKICPWCKTPIPHEVVESKPRTFLTWNSSDLDPLAKRGREFFTEHGLYALSLLAQHFLNYFRAGKFDDCPLDSKGKPDVKAQFKDFIEEFGIQRSESILFFFEERMIDKKAYMQNVDFRNELYNVRPRLESYLMKGKVCPLGNIIKEAVYLFQKDEWKDAYDDYFFGRGRSPVARWKFLRSGYYNIKNDYYIERMVQFHSLITKVLESILREMFNSREEMTSFFKSLTPHYFFKGDFDNYKRNLSTDLRKTSTPDAIEVQVHYDRCCTTKWREVVLHGKDNGWIYGEIY